MVRFGIEIKQFATMKERENGSAVLTLNGAANCNHQS
jgi:hypothetical protein